MRLLLFLAIYVAFLLTPLVRVLSLTVFPPRQALAACAKLLPARTCRFTKILYLLNFLFFLAMFYPPGKSVARPPQSIAGRDGSAGNNTASSLKFGSGAGGLIV